MTHIILDLDKALKISLFSLFFSPPLVFMPGRIAGQWAFVDYSQPKLGAIMVLSWTFLLIFSIRYGNDSQVRHRLAGLLRDPFIIMLGAFLSYICLTSFNSVVFEASFYELSQYLTFFLVLVAVSSLVHDERYLTIVISAICLSFAIVVLIGFLQMKIFIPWLVPVGSGANFPSTMGYKNPAALAVTGQWFLLLYLLYVGVVEKKRMLVMMVSLLALSEAGFIAALQSRTSYFAFFVTLVSLFLGAIYNFVRRGGGNLKNTLRYGLTVVLVGFMVFGGVVKFYPKANERFKATVIYLENPEKFLETDRAAFIINSFYMAKDNFFGVGIGNWRFEFPFYRKIDRKEWFNRYFQVQKAHCDYAQILGETGWPGFMLWLTVIGILFLRGLKNAITSPDFFSLILFSQFVAFLLLMAFDYCVQMPYHKFAFFSVMSLLFGKIKKIELIRKPA